MENRKIKILNVKIKLWIARLCVLVFLLFPVSSFAFDLNNFKEQFSFKNTKDDFVSLFVNYHTEVIKPAGEMTKDILNLYVNDLLQPVAKETKKVIQKTNQKTNAVFSFYEKNILKPAGSEVFALVDDYQNNLDQFSVLVKDGLNATRPRGSQSASVINIKNLKNKKVVTQKNPKTVAVYSAPKIPSQNSQPTKKVAVISNTSSVQNYPVTILNNQTATISDSQLFTALEKLFNKKVPDNVIAKLKGEKGDQGVQGVSGSNAMYPLQPVYNIAPSVPSPLPSVFIPGGVAQSNTFNNFSGATLFSATDLSATSFISNTANINNLTVTQNTTLSGLSINGNLTVSGTVTGVLPDQTGNTGKYLTTDGTTSSWGSITGGMSSLTAGNGLNLTGTATDPIINLGGTMQAGVTLLDFGSNLGHLKTQYYDSGTGALYESTLGSSSDAFNFSALASTGGAYGNLSVNTNTVAFNNYDPGTSELHSFLSEPSIFSFVSTVSGVRTNELSLAGGTIALSSTDLVTSGFSRVRVQTSGFDFLADDAGGNQIRFDATTTTATITGTTTGFAGIKYGGNYRADFANESLVDKGYVTEALNGHLQDVVGEITDTTSFIGFYTAASGALQAKTNALFTFDASNVRMGIGIATPTAVLHLKAGTTSASSAPLKFTSGSLLTTAEAGAVEFLTDAFYGTITTGAARKTFAFLESPSFTTPSLGAATATSINGMTLTSSTGVFTLTNAKTFSVSNTLTLAGTDGSTLNVGTGGTLGTNAYTSTAYAPLASPTFTGTVTIPTPFTLGATSVTSTGTQLNYLASATGTTGTTSTNLVFSTSPTLVTPALGTPSALVLTNATGLPAASVLAGTFGAGAYVMNTSLSVPSIITASGALGVTPAAGSNLNVTLSTTGDFAVNTNQLYVDTSAGYVGIGTTSPSYKLDVQHSVTSGNPLESVARFYQTQATNGWGNPVVIRNADTSVYATSAIGFQNAAGTTVAQLGSAGSSYTNALYPAFTANGTFIYTTGKFGLVSDNASGQFAFQIGNGASTVKMLLNGTGLGIGTTSPSAVLHLKAGTTAASTAPLKFTSGSLQTTAEAGAVEFLTDKFYGTITTGAARKTFAFLESPSFTTPALGVATGTGLALTSANTTEVTTASALALNANSLTTGTGFYAASSSLTSGLLVDLQVSGTAAAASQTALNILTAGATATNAITTYGAQISNTHTNATSGTNVALYLNASGATTANYGLIVNAGLVGIGTITPSSKLDVTTTSLGTTQAITSGISLVNTTAAAAGAQQISPAMRWRGYGWKTTATAASQSIDFLADVLPVQGTTAPTGKWRLTSDINATGTFTELMSMTTGGIFGLPDGGQLRFDSGVGTYIGENGNGLDFRYGAAATIQALTLGVGGTASAVFPEASAVSKSNILSSGTWYSGGSATTTKPHILIEPSGTTSTGWSTAGTGLGINAPNTTNVLMDLQTNGVSRLRFTPTGANGATLAIGGDSIAFTSGGISAISSNYALQLNPGTSSSGVGYGVRIGTSSSTVTARVNIDAETLTSTATNGVLHMVQTWNTSTNATTAIKLNITNTLSHASSLLMDLQVDGSSKFSVDKAGLTTLKGLALTSANTTEVTTASALALNANSLTTGTGFYAASSSLTSGLLVDLQVSGTAAAASQTALNILTAGATATNAITTYGAQISNTHTNATSGTNVALYLNASGATTANYGLIVNAGYVGIGTTAPSSALDVTTTALGVTQTNTSGLSLVNTTAAAAAAQQISPAIRWRGNGWKTNATAASQTIDYRAYVLPVQGSSAAAGNWILEYDLNGGGYTSALTHFTSGYFQIGSNGSNRIGTSSDNSAYSTAGVSMLYQAHATSTNNVFSHAFISSTRTGTTGTIGMIKVNQTWTPSASSSANYNGLNVNYTIDATAGAASGTGTGILVNATETSLNGLTHNLLDLQVASSSKFKVSNAGLATAASLTVTGTSTLGDITTSDSTPTLSNAGFATCTGLTTVSNVVTCTASDRTLKTNFQNYNDGLAFIRNIQPQTYTFKEGTAYFDNNRVRLGFIAQEIGEAGLTDAVLPIGNGLLQVDFNAVTAAAVSAIKELDTKITGIENLDIATTFFGNLKQWFANTANGIEDFFARKIHTRELCVGDESGAETCITKAQLDALLGGQNNQANANNSNTGGSTETDTSNTENTATPEEQVIIEMPTGASVDPEPIVDTPPVDLAPIPNAGSIEENVVEP